LKVFIFSHSEDVHADAIEKDLNIRGTQIYRLNSDDVSNWTLQYDKNTISLDFYGEIIGADANDRYFIRFLPDERNFLSKTTNLHPDVANFCARQHSINFQDSLSALTYILRGIDKPHQASFAQSKPLQLMLARKLGLFTPDTYTGSNPHSAWTFSDSIISSKGQICQKPVLGRMLEYNGRKYSSFTELTEVTRDELDSLPQCPITLQRYIPKEYELRVAVIDDKALATRIESQVAGGRTAIDWRNYDIPKTPHYKHDLPKKVAEQLIQLNKELGVRYSCMDLIVDKEGSHVFLEANIKGQWLWLDDLTGLGVTATLAEAITS
jgi:glutathione synthase/RimK-type ligase-like ATP-grasp enzyme